MKTPTPTPTKVIKVQVQFCTDISDVKNNTFTTQYKFKGVSDMDARISVKAYIKKEFGVFPNYTKIIN